MEFSERSSNPHARRGERWLLERVGRDARVRHRFVKPRTHSRLDREAVERYMGRIIEVREKLAGLIHMVEGQPARWPELGRVRHNNTDDGGIRNMGIKDGMVYIATRYHKKYNISGDIIHRSLLREVGESVKLFVVGVAVPGAVGGHRRGGGHFIIHVARRP
jgi:hypothetical protein